MTTQSSPLLDAAAGFAPDDKTGRRSKARAPSALPGMLWFAGWLFTIGFAKLVGFQAVLALIFWPYFLGRALG